MAKIKSFAALNRKALGGKVTAPYNFIPMVKEPMYFDKDALIDHDVMDDELFSGYIDYEIQAKTDIFVGSGEKDYNGVQTFYKNPYGIFSIPGSTIRGLIRNNVQILGSCSVAEDIDDYNLMFREIASGKDRNRYAEILGVKQVNVSDEKSYKINIRKNVKAGYIENKDGKYRIYKTQVDKIRDSFGEMN